MVGEMLLHYKNSKSLEPHMNFMNAAIMIQISLISLMLIVLLMVAFLEPEALM